MAGISTEHLADQIQETNQRLADSNERMTDAMLELSRKFDQFRVEVAEQFGKVNANLEGFRGRTETSLAVAKWAAGIIATIVLGLVGWSYSAFERAVKLEASATRLEASIVELREHAKEQDQRIARNFELITAPPKGNRP